MNGAIAIFVKTPGFSPVKTRLAAHLGQHAAETFHLASAHAVAAVAQSVSRNKPIQSYFAVAEQSALSHAHWQRLPSLWQGEGGLGERMAHIYQSLLKKHAFVILVGADSPQMTRVDLINAVLWLTCRSQRMQRMTFGPSQDGGFWLFGGNCSVPLSLWTSVTYSTASTGVQFFNQIQQLGKVQTLTQLLDVDLADDLPMMLQLLKKLSKPLPEQHLLMQTIKTMLTPVAIDHA